MILLATLAAAGLAFTLSASAGFGGSLLLVPALSLLLGPKEGVALAALLLACNNVWKVGAYRKSIPVRAAAAVVLCTVIGAAIGARLLVATPERWVSVAVIGGFALTLLLEARRRAEGVLSRAPGGLLAFGSGATSGFSGTSGPLKGAALRTLGLDRLHFVGAASVVSLAGDATKTGIYADAALLGPGAWRVAIAAVPVMAAATLLGRALNERMGERAFMAVFWTVMAGYTARLAVAW